MGLLVAFALPGCGGGSDTQLAAPPPSVTVPPSTVPPTVDEIVAAVHVIDTGFTSHPEPGEPVSLGVVIENTGDQVLTGVPVTVHAYDQTGADLGEASPDWCGSWDYIPVLRPGERVGLGGLNHAVGASAAELRVEVGEPQSWYPPAQSRALPVSHAWLEDGAFTVDGVHVTQDELGQPSTTFTVRSSYSQPIEVPWSYAVFYDPAGEIVGGACDQGLELGPGGTSSGYIGIDDPYDPIPFPTIDPARTEISFPGVLVEQR